MLCLQQRKLGFLWSGLQMYFHFPPTHDSTPPAVGPAGQIPQPRSSGSECVFSCDELWQLWQPGEKNPATTDLELAETPLFWACIRRGLGGKCWRARSQMAEEQRLSLLWKAPGSKQGTEAAQESSDWGIIKQNPPPNQLLDYFASVKKYRHFYQLQCVSAAQRPQKSNLDCK